MEGSSGSERGGMRFTSDQIEEVVAHLRTGGILGYPTETVYGLGGDPSPRVIETIRTLKGREEKKPFLLLLPGGEPDGKELRRWGFNPPDWAQRLSELFWPGPLTLVLKDTKGRFPLGVRSTGGGVAVRISSDPFVQDLMARWGGPLISTSANRGGELSSLTAEEVRAAFASVLGGDQILIVDGGPSPSSVPSTLIDCTGGVPLLLRRGAIPVEVLRTALPELHEDGY